MGWLDNREYCIDAFGVPYLDFSFPVLSGDWVRKYQDHKSQSYLLIYLYQLFCTAVFENGAREGTGLLRQRYIQLGILGNASRCEPLSSPQSTDPTRHRCCRYTMGFYIRASPSSAISRPYPVDIW